MDCFLDPNFRYHHFPNRQTVEEPLEEQEPDSPLEEGFESPFPIVASSSPTVNFWSNEFESGEEAVESRGGEGGTTVIAGVKNYCSDPFSGKVHCYANAAHSPSKWPSERYPACDSSVGEKPSWYGMSQNSNNYENQGGRWDVGFHQDDTSNTSLHGNNLSEENGGSSRKEDGRKDIPDVVMEVWDKSWNINSALDGLMMLMERNQFMTKSLTGGLDIESLGGALKDQHNCLNRLQHLRLKDKAKYEIQLAKLRKALQQAEAEAKIAFEKLENKDREVSRLQTYIRTVQWQLQQEKQKVSAHHSFSQTSGTSTTVASTPIHEKSSSGGKSEGEGVEDDEFETGEELTDSGLKDMKLHSLVNDLTSCCKRLSVKPIVSSSSVEAGEGRSTDLQVVKGITPCDFEISLKELRLKQGSITGFSMKEWLRHFREAWALLLGRFKTCVTFNNRPTEKFLQMAKDRLEEEKSTLEISVAALHLESVKVMRKTVEYPMKLEDSEAEKRRLIQELEQSRRSDAEKKRDNEVLAAELQKRLKELEVLKVADTELQRDHEETLKALLELQEEYAKKAKEFSLTSQAHEKDRSQILEELEKTKKEMESLHSTKTQILEQLEKNKKEKESIHSDKTQIFEQLEKTKKEMESLHSDKTQILEESGKTKKEMEILRSDNTLMAQDIARLKSHEGLRALDYEVEVERLKENLSVAEGSKPSLEYARRKSETELKFLSESKARRKTEEQETESRAAQPADVSTPNSPQARAAPPQKAQAMLPQKAQAMLPQKAQAMPPQKAKAMPPQKSLSPQAATSLGFPLTKQVSRRLSGVQDSVGVEPALSSKRGRSLSPIQFPGPTFRSVSEAPQETPRSRRLRQEYEKQILAIEGEWKLALRQITALEKQVKEIHDGPQVGVAQSDVIELEKNLAELYEKNEEVKTEISCLHKESKTYREELEKKSMENKVLVERIEDLSEQYANLATSFPSLEIPKEASHSTISPTNNLASDFFAMGQQPFHRPPTEKSPPVLPSSMEQTPRNSDLNLQVLPTSQVLQRPYRSSIGSSSESTISTMALMFHRDMSTEDLLPPSRALAVGVHTAPLPLETARTTGIDGSLHQTEASEPFAGTSTFYPTLPDRAQNAEARTLFERSLKVAKDAEMSLLKFQVRRQLQVMKDQHEAEMLALQTERDVLINAKQQQCEAEFQLRLEELRMDHSEKEQSVSGNYQNELERIQKELQETQQNVEELEKAVDLPTEYRKKLKTAEEENFQLRLSVESFQTQLFRLKREMDEMSQQNKELSSQVDKLHHHSLELQRRQADRPSSPTRVAAGSPNILQRSLLTAKDAEVEMLKLHNAQEVERQAFEYEETIQRLRAEHDTEMQDTLKRHQIDITKLEMQYEHNTRELELRLLKDAASTQHHRRNPGENSQSSPTHSAIAVGLTHCAATDMGMGITVSSSYHSTLGLKKELADETRRHQQECEDMRKERNQTVDELRETFHNELVERDQQYQITLKQLKSDYAAETKKRQEEFDRDMVKLRESCDEQLRQRLADSERQLNQLRIENALELQTTKDMHVGQLERMRNEKNDEIDGLQKTFDLQQGNTDMALQQENRRLKLEYEATLERLRLHHEESLRELRVQNQRNLKQLELQHDALLHKTELGYQQESTDKLKEYSQQLRLQEEQARKRIEEIKTDAMKEHELLIQRYNEKIANLLSQHQEEKNVIEKLLTEAKGNCFAVQRQVAELERQLTVERLEKQTAQETLEKEKQKWERIKEDNCSRKSETVSDGEKFEDRSTQTEQQTRNRPTQTKEEEEGGGQPSLPHHISQRPLPSKILPFQLPSPPKRTEKASPRRRTDIGEIAPILKASEEGERGLTLSAAVPASRSASFLKVSDMLKKVAERTEKSEKKTSADSSEGQSPSGPTANEGSTFSFFNRSRSPSLFSKGNMSSSFTATPDISSANDMGVVFPEEGKQLVDVHASDDTMSLSPSCQEMMDDLEEVRQSIESMDCPDVQAEADVDFHWQHASSEEGLDRSSNTNIEEEETDGDPCDGTELGTKPFLSLGLGRLKLRLRQSDQGDPVIITQEETTKGQVKPIAEGSGGFKAKSTTVGGGGMNTSPISAPPASRRPPGPGSPVRGFGFPVDTSVKSPPSWHSSRSSSQLAASDKTSASDKLAATLSALVLRASARPVFESSNAQRRVTTDADQSRDFNPRPIVAPTTSTTNARNLQTAIPRLRHEAEGYVLEDVGNVLSYSHSNSSNNMLISRSLDGPDDADANTWMKRKPFSPIAVSSTSRSPCSPSATSVANHDRGVREQLERRLNGIRKQLGRRPQHSTGGQDGARITPKESRSESSSNTEKHLESPLGERRGSLSAPFPPLPRRERSNNFREVSRTGSNVHQGAPSGSGAVSGPAFRYSTADSQMDLDQATVKRAQQSLFERRSNKGQRKQLEALESLEKLSRVVLEEVRSSAATTDDVTGQTGSTSYLLSQSKRGFTAGQRKRHSPVDYEEAMGSESEGRSDGWQ